MPARFARGWRRGESRGWRNSLETPSPRPEEEVTPNYGETVYPSCLFIGPQRCTRKTAPSMNRRFQQERTLAQRGSFYSHS